MLLCDRLPGILMLPATRNHVAFSGSRMSRASNNFCHAGITTTCPRSISCQSCQSPVPNVEHTCRCQAMTAVTESFSPLFPFLQRVSRSMKSVSFAMLKAEKAWAWQTPQTLCWEELYLLMLLCDRLPGILLLPATRNRVAFSGSRMSRASNNFCHARRTKICPRSISCQCC